MKPNVGETDKIIRICISLVFISIAYFYDVWWLYLIAIIPLITALVSYCPTYTLFGISTIEEKKGERFVEIKEKKIKKRGGNK